MRKRDRFAVRGGTAAAVCLLGTLGIVPARAQTTIPPQVKKSPSLAPPRPNALANKASNTLDLRDAPIRSALELFFNANNTSFSIDVAIGRPRSIRDGEYAVQELVRDQTTVNYANKSPEESLRLLCQSAPNPLVYSLKSDQTTPLYYFVTPIKREMPVRASMNEDSEEMKGQPGAKEVIPYRVCGILRHDDHSTSTSATTWYAMLIRDAPGRSAYASAKIVQLNAWVAGVGENSPPLRVTGIDIKGVTVLPLGGTAYKIPLVALAERENKAPAPTASAPNPVTIPRASEEVVEETIDTLTLRGASALSAMELVLQVNNIPYVFDDAFPRTARISMGRSEDRIVLRQKPNESPSEDLLKMILRLSSVGVSYRLDPGANGTILFFAPRRDSEEHFSLTPLPLPVDPLLPKYVNERQVPRRVRGLLFRDTYHQNRSQATTTTYALLEMDTPGASVPTATEIVKTGTLISSPIKDGPQVRVVGIDTEGVLLQAEGDEPFRVPLVPHPKP